MPVQKLSVTTYMADVRNLLRPVSFMDIAQEIATVGAKQLHFDDSVTVAAANAVWVLAARPLRGHHPRDLAQGYLQRLLPA